MHIGHLRQHRQRALDQLKRRPDFSALVGYNSQEVQRVGVIRVFLQRFAVQGLRTLQSSGLMMRKSGAHGSQSPCTPPRFPFLFIGCDSRHPYYSGRLAPFPPPATPWS
jgi:hypothetical protein